MGGWVALEVWKLRLTSAKVEVEVEAELGNFRRPLCSLELLYFTFSMLIPILGV